MGQFLVQDGTKEFDFYSTFACPRIWDPVHARFEKCALPYIAAIPAIISLCIIASSFLQLVPWRLKFPHWTRNIIKESVELETELPFRPLRSFNPFTIKLLTISIFGFLLQLFTVFHPVFRIAGLPPAASWVVACITIIIYRPLRTPKALLVLFCSIFVSQCIVLAAMSTKIRANEVPTLLGIFTSMGGILIIINMPLRDPSLPAVEISPAFGPPSSELRTPEDNLTLWQYMSVSWMTPLMSIGRARQLNDEDVWDLGYDFKHKRLSDKFKELKGSVLRRLLSANGLDLILITILSLVQLSADICAPLYLQKILQSLENPISPRRAALIYAGLQLTHNLIRNQASVFLLWYGRRCYERSRGELITMLYEKTLARKVVSISSEAKSNSHENGDANGVKKAEERGAWSKALMYLLLPYRACCGRRKVKAPEKDELATTGKILNLMRFDAYEIAQRFWEFSNLINQPLGLLLSIFLTWRLMGWPSLIGAIAIVFAQITNAYIARILLRWEKDRRVATDKKLHKVTQLVESIRHLRWYGWQDVWITRIMDSRKHELKLRVITSLWKALISTVNVFGSGMFPVLAFFAYTVLAGLPLRVDVAFPALQFFGIIDYKLRDIPDLITALLNAKISINRIDEFMKEPDKLDAETSLNSSGDIELKNASFSWPGATEPVLRDVSLSISPGLTVVFGQVGAGKSALLQALLGEADLVSGEYHRSSEMVGYCAQIPWLQSMSIRDNIIFSAPYDSIRYKAVMEACALIPDMSNFKNGDLSLIGENGVGLSGGQKARISLARAVYSQAKVVFLDDPLSALDHQTAETIVRRCITGPLLKGRTTILVTHRTELCIEFANQVVEIHEGRAKALDPAAIPPSSLTRIRTESAESQKKDDDENAIPEKFMEDEHRAHGGVLVSVYWEYIKAGKLKWWFVLLCSLVFHRFIFISNTWFIKSWGEAYNKPIELLWSNPLDRLPSPEDNIRPWLIGFLLIATARSIALLIFQGVSIIIIYFAGKVLFERVMVTCTHATFRFYDVTPVGRLMNRLTSDINTVDGNISSQFQQISMMGVMWVSSILVIASIAPIFLVVAVALTVTFIYIFSHFLPASQSLRRLEMVSLSPLISNFGALAEGLTTVRAFCAQYRFQENVFTVTDTFQKMDHFYWSLQAWLEYRFECLADGGTFVLVALAIYTNVSAGLTAFLLSAAMQFVIATHQLCRAYGQLQMDFVSVERVVELLHLEQEPPGSIDPPAYWPKLGGDIVFEDVTMRYAPHLDPALTNVSLKIKGGSTTALIGRTGSGKSTLALSLLATTLPSSGRILIDGIDISKVNTQALRTRITFLAQEPVLFPGTMRQNLDPLDEFSSSDCESVLSKIASRHQWTLDTNIDTGGKNLSQGQRQLVGLARALLRRSAIVIMDEATASIDTETAMRIQEILREEMKESTVITIAHRVEAVRNADFCVELAKGKVLEVGEPGKMISHMEE